MFNLGTQSSIKAFQRIVGVLILDLLTRLPETMILSLKSSSEILKNLDTWLCFVSKFFTLSSDNFLQILKRVLGYCAISHKIVWGMQVFLNMPVSLSTQILGLPKTLYLQNKLGPRKNYVSKIIRFLKNIRSPKNKVQK